MIHQRRVRDQKSDGAVRLVALVLLVASLMFLVQEARLFLFPLSPALSQESSDPSYLRGVPSLDIVRIDAVSGRTPHPIQPHAGSITARKPIEEIPSCSPPCIRLRNDVEMPLLIYGTAWKEERSEKLVSLALNKGFRAFDTANQRRHYNEVGAGAAISKAINEGRIRRSELFLQSKYTFPRGHMAGQEPYDLNAAPGDQVIQSFESSLRNFGTTYLDSFIIHGPLNHGVKLSDEDIEVWLALEKLYGSGKVRAIGVSNFGQQQLRQLLAHPRTTVVPHVAQIRTFASSGWDDRVGGVRAVCQEAGVVFEAFSLLTANRRELSSSVVRAIAEKWDSTKEQIAFRFAFGEGMAVLTGTTDPHHMDQDLAVAHDTIADVEGRNGSWQLELADATAIRNLRLGSRKHSMRPR